MIAEGDKGRLANRVDLNNLQLIEQFAYDGKNSGDYIFWRCLETVLQASPEEMREAFVAIVREPGKARTVTKGPVALRVVLDVINKMASYPLKKLDSSEAGMSKDAHGWLFFKKFFSGENHDLTFQQKGSFKPKVGEEFLSRTERRIYTDTFVEFTDYETATDSFNHEVGSIIMKLWFARIGLPSILKRIAFGVITQKRKIIFEGSGIFKDVGEHHEGTQRFIWLNSGFLMGDYLTKVILHIQNAAARKSGPFMTGGDQSDELRHYLPGFRPNKLGSVIEAPFTIIDERVSQKIAGPHNRSPTSMVLDDLDVKISEFMLNKEVNMIGGPVVPGGYKETFSNISLEPGILRELQEASVKTLLSKGITKLPNRDPLSSPTMSIGPNVHGTKGHHNFPFPWPGVIIGVITSGGTDYLPNSGFHLGYVPKVARDPKILKAEWEIELSTGLKWMQKVPIHLGEDPDDHLLNQIGLKPVNVYRSKKTFIVDPSGWKQFHKDHKAFLEKKSTGRESINPGLVRQRSMNKGGPQSVQSPAVDNLYSFYHTDRW